jgi:hypothetical protein
VVRIGLGEHRVVEVARVLAVDGDQRQPAQVEAMAERRRAGLLGLARGGLRELDGNVVGGDRDQADGARVAHRPDPLEHPGAARQVRAGLLDPDDVARPRAVAVGRADVELAPQPAIGRGHQAEGAAAGRLLVQAEDLLRAASQAADDAGLVGVLAAPFQRREHAIADGRCGGAARAVRIDLDARCGAVFLFVVAPRHGQQMAVLVDAHDLQYGDVSQCFGILECLGAVGGDVANVAQFAQELLQLDALVAFQPVGARDLALAHRGGALLDEGQQLVAGRDAAFSHRFRCAAGVGLRLAPWARPSSSWRPASASRRVVGGDRRRLLGAHRPGFLPPPWPRARRAATPPARPSARRA